MKNLLLLAGVSLILAQLSLSSCTKEKIQPNPNAQKTATVSEQTYSSSTNTASTVAHSGCPHSGANTGTSGAGSSGN